MGQKDHTIRSFTIKKKLTILSHYQKDVRGSGVKAISKRFKLDPKTLKLWIKNKPKYLEEEARPGSDIRRTRKLGGSGRKPRYLQLENRLMVWVNQKKLEGLNLTEKDYKDQGLIIAEELEREGIIYNPPFKGSNGWLFNFKVRNSIGVTKRAKPKAPSKPTITLMDTTSFVNDVYNH